MISRIIDSWYNKVKQLLFKYKDGFYVLPLISNTPEATIKSIVKMPFVYHKKKERIFGTNNPFVKADVHYCEIEKELWCIYAKAHYKENINYINVKEEGIQSEYYMLFIEYSTNIGKTKNTLLNGISYSNCSWVLTKPLVVDTQYCFKGKDSISVALYFTKRWLEKNLNNYSKSDIEALNSFINSKSKMIIYPETNTVTQALCISLDKIISIENNNKKTTELKAFYKSAFMAFLNCSKKQSIPNTLLDFSHNDRKKMQQVEKLLLDNIQSKFLGIDFIAKEIGMSPTKLKTTFKQIYGDTIFKFFRKHQMHAAKRILKQTDIQIKDIAILLGYNSASKFSSAYKEVFGVLPSQE